MRHHSSARVPSTVQSLVLLAHKSLPFGQDKQQLNAEAAEIAETAEIRY